MDPQVINIPHINRPEQKRVRKSISQLTDYQKQQYFLLVRLLHILTPPEQNNMRKFRFIADNEDQHFPENLNKQLFSPKCLYDCIVYFHSTSCQHMFDFFPYWHRWLMLRYQRFQLYAHNSILNQDFLDGQAQRIWNMVDPTRKDITKDIIKALLQKIRLDYKKIVDQLKTQGQGEEVKYIAAHYWDYFNNADNINYPDGYISSNVYYADSFKNADDLIRRLWDQDSIYEINLKTRYNYRVQNENFSITIKKDLVQKCKQLLANKDFWEKPNNASQQQIKFANDFFQKKFFSQYFRYLQISQRGTKTQSGENIIATQNITKMRQNVFTPDQVSFIFSGKDYPYYQVNNQHDDTPLNTFKKNRNNIVGYYCYARSLYTKPQDFIRKFCTASNSSSTFSMENPHNTLHNYQFYSMQDSSFSLINPIFFAYHGTIDLMLEYKIRRYTQDQNAKAARSVSAFFNNDLFKKNLGQNTKNFRNGWSKLFQQKHGNRPPTYGEYPIFKWINQDITTNENQTDVKEADFVVQESYNYRQIILGTQGQLQNVEQFDNVTYFDNINFKRTVQETKAPSPYSNNNIYCAVQLTIPSKIKHQNIFVHLKNQNGNTVGIGMLPIFKRGQTCPNCSKQEAHVLLFPLEQLTSQFSEYAIKRITSGQSGKQINNYFKDNLKIVVSNPDVKPRLVNGRGIVKIQNNAQTKMIFNLAQTANRKRLIEVKEQSTTEIQNPLTFNEQNKKYQGSFIFKNNHYQFTSFQGKDENNNQYNYEFPLYSQQTFVELKDGKVIEHLPLGSKQVKAQQTTIKHKDFINQVPSEEQ